jgi:DNA-binding protein HU-beta
MARGQRGHANFFNGEIWMNKGELVDAIASKSNLTKTQARDALDAALEAIESAVAGGDSVTLVGFGTFKAKTRAAREGRNPRTGQTIKIAAATTPSFSAGATFKQRVNEAASKKPAKKK